MKKGAIFVLAFLLVGTGAFAVTADLSDVFSSSSPSKIWEPASSVVDSFGAPDTAPMGIDVDRDNEWLWHTSEGTSGPVYTVDPTTGDATLRFYIEALVGSYDLKGNGLYYDSDNELLYIVDYNGNVSDYYDSVYVFDVSDPDDASLVEAHNFGTTNGVLGITYRDPYFYIGYLSTYQIIAYDDSWVQQDTYSYSGGGEIYYDYVDDVFYASAVWSAMIYVLDGDGLSTLDSFSFSGASYGGGCGICPNIGDYSEGMETLWITEFSLSDMFYQIENDYWTHTGIAPASLGEMKAMFQ